MTPSKLRRDPLFKGCTRPAMFWGVPILPLFIVGGGIGIVSTFTTVLLNILTVPAVLIMRAIVKHDDQAFRLIWQWLRFRVADRNRRVWGAVSFSPVQHTKRRMEA